MTNNELQRTLTRIADARDARRAASTDTPASAAAAARGTGARVQVGDLVFDARTGGEAKVIDVVPQSISSVGLVTIRYESGSTAVRAAGELVVRPTRPAGRS